MKILNPRRIREYRRAHPDAEANLRTWAEVVRAANWASFNEVRRTFNTADRVGDRVIFNIKGNTYRLVVWIDFERKLVVLKWFGTHEEYSRGEWNS